MHPLRWHRSLGLLALLPLLLLWALPGWAERPAVHPSLRNAELPPLISAEAFYADQQQSWRYRVSPDGRKLVWIAYKNGRPTIHFRALDEDKVQTIDTERPVYRAYWAHDSRRLVFYWDDDGDENYHLYIADSAHPERAPRNMTPLEGTTVWWHQAFRDDPARMLVRLNARDPSEHDLYELDIVTGDLERIAENPGNGQGWVTDRDGTIIGRLRRTEGKRRVLEVPQGEDGSKGWRTLIDWAFDEKFWVQGHPLPGGDFIWGLSNRGRDRIALVKLDLKTGAEEVVYSHPLVDVENAWIDDLTYRPLFATAWPGYMEQAYLDEELGRDLEVFRQDGPANIRPQSLSRDRQVMTLEVETERSGKAHYLFDRRTKTKTLLAEQPIAKHRDKLSITQPISYTARDGLRLHGYLILPNGVEPRRLPTVLRVHGGPWARDRWGFSADDQFLANRGYAVLRINYRGSTGYGRAFEQGARREFARKMHDDLIDGVNWLIERGVADPEKIAIFGRSYGGYATMVGLTFTPEVFAAGINVVGVADLVMALETFPPYWKPWIERWMTYVGDPKNPEDRADMAARSPINFIDRIKRPLLMAQGANDVRVVRAHSDRIAETMKKAGLPFSYIVFEDEGHAIRKWQNRVELAQAMEQFLADHLGGRAAEPQ